MPDEALETLHVAQAECVGSSLLISQKLPSMPDPLMYEEEHFVVLETNQSEQFLTKSELQQKLQGILKQMNPQDLPWDLQKFDSVVAQSQHLLDTSCELDVGVGEYLQWYAVRLEK